MRSLGLDVGDKRIGVALSDPEGILASPLQIINCQGDAVDIARIAEIVAGQDVARVIVGFPRNMNGTLGEQAQKVKEFTEELSKHITVPVELRDERLSTVSAQRQMRDNRPKKSRSRGKIKNKTRYDDVAAAIILQEYLEEKRQFE